MGKGENCWWSKCVDKKFSEPWGLEQTQVRTTKTFYKFDTELDRTVLGFSYLSIGDQTSCTPCLRSRPGLLSSKLNISWKPNIWDQPTSNRNQTKIYLLLRAGVPNDLLDVKNFTEISKNFYDFCTFPAPLVALLCLYLFVFVLCRMFNTWPTMD